MPPGAASSNWQPPAPDITAPSGAPPAITSAAVLGRPGEVEPVAAALALALRRHTKAKAATVAIVGPELPDRAEGGAAAAARRLAARLGDHGVEAHARGRLAWVRLDPESERLVVGARRVTLVAAPAVLAVTAPRTAAIDDVLADQDLLVLVAPDPEAPLMRLAAAGLGGAPVVTVRPLGRGLNRALARAGMRAAPPVRRLLEEER